MSWNWYKIRNRLFRRYDLIRTGLAKTEWWDTDTKMLYGMMSLVVDLVEKEKWFEHIDFEGSGEEWVHAKKEVEEIYAWWKNYSNRGKEIDQALTDWHEYAFQDADDHNRDINEHFSKMRRDDKERELSDHLHSLEKKLEDEEGEMIIRLVKIRKYLWT